MASSWWKDSDFQRHLLTFLCRDRNFLKNCGSLLRAKDFKPNRDETDENFLIATLALDFWKKYNAPIADMLRPSIAEFCHKNHVEGDRKKAVTKLVDKINSGEKLVAVQAMEDKVLEYARSKMMKDSIEELISKQEEGELSQKVFLQICKKVVDYSDRSKLQASKFLDADELEHRIARRKLASKDSRPLLMLPGFDSKTRGIGRGDVGLLMALYKKGKSLGLAHLADGYAKQKLKVLYITLEDPKIEVEDRMDASMAYMPIEKLDKLPNKLRKRFKKFSKRINGQIRVVDATEEGVSVEEIDELWERLRDQGFTADVVIIDYDDEIKPPRQYKAEASSRRSEFADIYRALRKFAAKRQVILWTAAQTKRMKDNVKIVTPDMLAEDISKARKVTLAIGIGQGETHDDARYCYIAINKRGKARFGFEIMASPDKGIFYDEERSRVMLKRKEKKAA